MSNWAYQPLAPSAAQIQAAGGGAMVGSISAAFGVTGALTGAGALSGAVSFSFSPVGVLTGAGALSGSVSFAFSTAGVLTGAGALIGSVSAAFTATGSLADAAGGAMSGAVSFAFATVGGLTGSGDLVGSISMSLDVTGSLTSAAAIEEAPVGAGGGSSRPYRYISPDSGYKKKKDYTAEDEEELKRLLLESEEKHRKQIAILEERSEDLLQQGVALSRIRTEIDSLKSDLEHDNRLRIDFDINLQIRLMEIKRKRIMTILLLMSAA